MEVNLTISQHQQISVYSGHHGSTMVSSDFTALYKCFIIIIIIIIIIILLLLLLYLRDGLKQRLDKTNVRCEQLRQTFTNSTHRHVSTTSQLCILK